MSLYTKTKQWDCFLISLLSDTQKTDRHKKKPIRTCKTQKG